MEDRRYNYMENVLQRINGSFISLPEHEVRRNNQVLEDVLRQLITKMKQKSALFNESYSRVFYGGSYYDGLKVGRPEEFDLDLLLNLPKSSEPTLKNSNIPGFVHLQLQKFNEWQNKPEANRWLGLDRLLDDDHYLVTSKVSAWIESVVTTALNEFPKSGCDIIFRTTSGELKGRIHKGGPAHTLKLSGSIDGRQVVLNIDLVPCFVFSADKWPPSPYRANPVQNRPTFFIVPKKPANNIGKIDRYWRLSFQEQERELINNSQNLKPSIKLLKKLRDNMGHYPISSYYIKTIFLWQVVEDKSLFDKSLSYVFMMMLSRYKQCLENKKIPYFWNRNNNLMGNIDEKTLQDIANRLQRVIGEIERDPLVVARHLVNQSELAILLNTETSEAMNNVTRMQPAESNTSNSSNCILF